MSISENIKTVEVHIAEAKKKQKIEDRDVTLIAVSKTKSVEEIREAYDAGMREFGENKVQEIRDKYDQFPKDAHWHMIGHLQTNKVKYIIDKVTMIHSVDSLKLAKIIEKEGAKHNLVMDILIQVMVAYEETKFGINMEELEMFLQEIGQLPHIRVRGLMTVAPYVQNEEENRQIFAKLNEILVDMNNKNIDNVTMDVLSMGMTNDYGVAIEEGATMVRVGTGIFGERNYNKSH